MKVMSGSREIKFDDIMQVAENTFRSILQDAEFHVGTFFPIKSGDLRNSVKYIDDKANLRAIVNSTAEHAIYVEKMSGVNWTNPLTSDQPHHELKKYLKFKFAELLRDNFKSIGIDVI